MGVKNASAAHIKEDANCISKMVRTVDKVRKKAVAAIAETAVAAVMGRPPPRERGPPAKSTRRAKVTAPEVISFKSMAACMKEAILKCQEFKRAKAKKGQGKKKVKYSEMDKLRRLMARQAASKARKANQARAKAEAREARLAANPIKNPGKYRKDKGFWSKDAKAKRSTDWGNDAVNRAARKQKRIDSYNKPENVARRAALTAQKQRLDTVTGAVTG